MNFLLRRRAHRSGPARFDAARRWPDVTAHDRPADNLDPADLRNVQLVVANHAHDAADLRDLLDVLGLTPTPPAPKEAP